MSKFDESLHNDEGGQIVVLHVLNVVRLGNGVNDAGENSRQDIQG